MFYVLCTFIVIVFGFGVTEKVSLRLPEFDFPSLEPLHYKVNNAVFNTAIVRTTINVSNFIAEGLQKTRFLAVKSYFADEVFQLEVDTQIPKITGAGEIEAVGSLSVFKLNGKGPANISMENIQTKWIIKGNVVNNTWSVEDFYAAPLIKKVRIYFTLISNKELNDLAVMFLNEFWPSLYRVLIPEAANIWNPWLCDLTNHFFSKVSFTEIFP